MKQTIEIEVPNGKKAVWKDGRVVFENIELPKTWEEFCETYKSTGNETFINNDSEIHKCFSIKNPDLDRNILPSNKAAEQHLAYMQLHQLRDCYRQGWVPVTFNGYSINRCYNPSINLIKFEIIEYYYTSKFLTFQTKEIAEEFSKRDYEIYLAWVSLCQNNLQFTGYSDEDNNIKFLFRKVEEGKFNAYSDTEYLTKETCGEYLKSTKDHYFIKHS